MEKEQLLNEITSQVTEQLKGYQTAQDVELAVKQATEKMHEDFAGLKALPEQVAKIEKAAIEIGEKLAKMKNMEPEKPHSIKEQLEAQADVIKQLVAGDKSAVGKTVVLPTSITSNFNGTVIPGIGKLDRRMQVLRGAFNNAPIAANNQLVIRYMDQASVTYGAAARTVGQAAGEMAITWQGYNLPIEQYSHIIPVALEMLENFDFVSSEINDELLTGLDHKIEYDLINGNGSTPNIFGLVGGSKYTAFSAGALASQIRYAGILDVIMAASTQVMDSTQYNPNIVLMNNYDAMALKLDKTEDGAYKFPNFLSANGMLIEGMRIVASPLITTNTLYVGDFSKRTLYSGGTVVTVGTNSDDFSKRKVSILANEPVAMLSKAIHQKAVVGVTSISDAIAALDKSA